MTIYCRYICISPFNIVCLPITLCTIWCLASTLSSSHSSNILLTITRLLSLYTLLLVYISVYLHGIEHFSVFVVEIRFSVFSFRFRAIVILNFMSFMNILNELYTSCTQPVIALSVFLYYSYLILAKVNLSDNSRPFSAIYVFSEALLACQFVFQRSLLNSQ